MLLNDALQNWRIALSIPRSVRIHNGHWAAFTDSQTVRFGPVHATLFGKTQLVEPALEIRDGAIGVPKGAGTGIRDIQLVIKNAKRMN